MGGVVDAEADGQNDVDAGDCVDRHVPKVQNTHSIDLEKNCKNMCKSSAKDKGK